MLNLSLPHNWTPRWYQKPAWRYMERGGRNAVIIAHRRYGKDELGLHHTACAAHDRVGSYVHMLPEYAQARKAIWNMVNPHTGKRRIDEAFPKELRSATREDEMFIQFKNGSTWQVAGSDNYDSLMGTSYAGMVHSEYALANPSAQGYFQPILMENKGWQMFITTPRGKNHAYKMYNHAVKQAAAGKDWYAELSGVDHTKAMPEADLEDELNRLQEMHGEDYGRALWLQEYFCSFEAALPGSIWGDCIEKARREGRIGMVPLEDVPVCTAWDLGRTDATAIWWYQIALGSVRVVDFHESSFKDIPYYGDLLRKKARERGFCYDTHYLPRDARFSTLAAAGLTIHQQMIEQDVGRIQIINSVDHVDGIQAARATFPYVWIDEVRCGIGLEHLKTYHYEWDEETHTFSNRPEHDASSHAASAFRTLALSWKPQARFKGGVAQEKINSTLPTFGELKRRHFRARQAERLFGG